MTLTDKEKRTLKETQLRNLKRRYAKMSNHSELCDECIELKHEIDALESEISSLQ